VAGLCALRCGPAFEAAILCISRPPRRWDQSQRQSKSCQSCQCAVLFGFSRVCAKACILHEGGQSSINCSSGLSGRVPLKSTHYYFAWTWSQHTVTLPKLEVKPHVQKGQEPGVMHTRKMLCQCSKNLWDLLPIIGCGLKAWAGRRVAVGCARSKADSMHRRQVCEQGIQANNYLNSLLDTLSDHQTLWLAIKCYGRLLWQAAGAATLCGCLLRKVLLQRGWRSDYTSWRGHSGSTKKNGFSFGYCLPSTFYLKLAVLRRCNKLFNYLGQLWFYYSSFWSTLSEPWPCPLRQKMQARAEVKKINIWSAQPISKPMRILAALWEG